METYTFLRAFADSWMLLAMFVFFVGCILWAFRPGSTEAYRDTKNIVFRNDDKPAGDDDLETVDDAMIKEAWK